MENWIITTALITGGATMTTVAIGAVWLTSFVLRAFIKGLRSE